MGTITFKEHVKYTLSHPRYGSQVIEEPEGWNNDDKEIDRNVDYHGIFPKFSNSLKFVGTGRDYLKMIYELYGPNTSVRLVKESTNPESDLFERAYDGFLDMSTYEEEDNKIGIKFNSGGLEQILKAREGDPFEVERETTVDGKPMEPLRIDKVALDGRKIFLKTVYEVKAPDNYGVMFIESNSGATRHQTVGVPLKLVDKSHEEAQDISINTNGTRDNGTVGNMFFLYSEVARTLKIKFSLTFRVSVVNQAHLDYAYFLCGFTRYYGPDLIAGDRTSLFEAHENEIRNTLLGTFHTVTFNQTVNIGVGDSLALEFLELADFRLDAHAEMRIGIDSMVGTLSIEEDSFYEPSTSKFVLAHELLDRYTEIMTNQKGNFYSQYFGRRDLGYPADGPGAWLGLAHGFWVRGFDKLPIGTDEEPNPYKSLTTSFKDAISSFGATHNVGLGIEKIGFKERIVVEDLKYFYNRNVTIKLPFQVKKVKRSVATKYFYSSIEIGYEKGGQYEEAMGLDEYNGKSVFTTVLTRLKQSYIKISKFRADSFGKEFARRKPKYRYATTDTQYDEDVFEMDLKPGAFGIFQERKWRDDFSQAPTGTYDPESATNLRLSPFNMLLKHGWMIMAGFTKELTEYISYASSTGNSKLKTKLIAGNEYAENGKIRNNELERARFIGEYVEFEHLVDFKIMQQVDGFTEINGRKIYNVYGLVEYINDNNETERGYLMNLKPNDNKWKVLKFNR